jgi:hypothetical protein
MEVAATEGGREGKGGRDTPETNTGEKATNDAKEDCVERALTTALRES